MEMRSPLATITPEPPLAARPERDGDMQASAGNTAVVVMTSRAKTSARGRADVARAAHGTQRPRWWLRCGNRQSPSQRSPGTTGGKVSFSNVRMEPESGRRH